MSVAGYENCGLVLALALVAVLTLSAIAGLRRDRPWLAAVVAVLAYYALVHGLELQAERAAPVVGTALIAAVALARLDGGRSLIPLLVACLLSLFQLRFDHLGHSGPMPAGGMPLFPILIAALTAFAASDGVRKQAWLFAGLIGMINTTSLAAYAYRHSLPSWDGWQTTGVTAGWTPAAVLLVFLVSRRLYPAAKQAGPAMTAFFVGILALFAVAGIWTDLRIGTPVLGSLSLCLAALLPVMLDEWRVEPERTFGLDRYFGEAMALAAVLGVAWMG